MTTPLPSLHDELARTIREARVRWRWKVVLRSLAVLVGAGVVTLLLAAYGLEQFRFDPSAIVVFRVITYLVLVALGWVFFVRPLARRVTDQQVALYLEEQEPSLDAILLSAVDLGASDSSAARAAESSALLRRLVETAIERCQELDPGRGVERQSQRRSLAAITGIAIAAAGVYLLGPAYLRHGARALLLPAGDVEAASPYRIDVTPGNATVARGADVAFTARLSGFASTEVDLFTRSGAGAPFERSAMIGGDEGVFESTLFGVRESLEYFAQSAGVRSPVFKIDVADLPFVERLELEYQFPAYTGLAPQKVEDGGDIAVLRGTTVRVRVHPTLPARAGQIVRDDRERINLTAGPDGAFEAGFDVTDDGFYRIDLQGETGPLVSASPQYTIEALADQPPTVSFKQPGRDLKPTNIEEVFVEATAEDDFGVRQLDLVFAKNGGEEKSVRLVGSRGRVLKDVTAGHTFFLEEMQLSPGDVVSYYARVTDNDGVQGGKSVTSDMYFLQIRPFRKDYRAADSQAGGQAGGGGANDPSGLSEQQRRIVSGTFNVVRDQKTTTADKFRQDVVFLTLAQSQLRARVQGLATQIMARVGEADESMGQIAALLTSAAESMGAAEGKLQARDPKGALSPEQQALNALLRAEETYRDVRVMLDQQAGGGGGGQSSAMAEELADLFQLEMDKLRNQYETLQRGQQQAADNQVDELLERLKELARRQEQEAERQRQLAGQRGSAGGGTGSARQRQLADETEEAARRLERLSREENRPDLADTARRLQEAADAMRRAAASGDASAFGQAREAADRLNQARERLERRRSDRMARDIQDAVERAQRLAAEQRDIESRVRGLEPDAGARRPQVQQLFERKDAQAEEVADLERQLDRTASDFRRERPEAARGVQEAADGIRNDKLKEKIRYSKGLVQGASPDAAAGFEDQIEADIASLQSRLRAAAEAVGSPARDARGEALDKARQLVRGMESMEQRLRDRQQSAAESGEESSRGQQGQQGQQGAQGQAGNRAQGGQSSQGQAGGGGRSDSGGDRDSTGAPGPTGGGGSRRPGQFDPDDRRQFQREARARRDEAQRLRRELQGLGADVGDLDRLIRGLRALDRPDLLADPEEAQRLQAQLVEGFRRFEFDLRRALGAESANQLLLSGSDEAPREYRKLIEDYYRALAREQRK